jgi:Ca2+-binding EF-hand superfamily protein
VLQLDRSEWKADGRNEEDFAVYDLNGDGKVDADEYSHMRKTEQELRKLDADGDGKITRSFLASFMPD